MAVHERIYSPGGWSVKLEHDLTTLTRKPGALDSSLALKQMPEKIQRLFNKHFAGKAKDFVFLLQYARNNNFTDNDIVEACQTLSGRGIRHISADQIKAMMHANNDPQETLTPSLSLPGIQQEGSSLVEGGAMKILLDLSQMMDGKDYAKDYILIN